MLTFLINVIPWIYCNYFVMELNPNSTFHLQFRSEKIRGLGSVSDFDPGISRVPPQSSKARFRCRGSLNKYAGTKESLDGSNELYWIYFTPLVASRRGSHALFGAVWFTAAVNSVCEWLFPVPDGNNNLEHAA